MANLAETDPGRRAAQNIEAARDLLVAAARLVPAIRGSAFTVGEHAEAMENKVERLCDELRGKIILKYPGARRPSAKLVLP